MVDTELYNEDELHAPDWMNEDFFIKVLKNCENAEKVQIKKFKITPGTSKSDHYGSIIFRAQVHYNLDSDDATQFRSMVIKSMPVVEGQKMDLLGDMQVFETEIKMYTEILPKVEKILRQYGDKTQLCARSLYHTLTPRKLIVFEDLVHLGYQTISNRTTNMEEVRTALLKVAKLHAVSYKLAQGGYANVTDFKNNFFTSNQLKEMDLCKNAIKSLIEICKKHTDLEVYVPHLTNVDEKLIDNLLSEYRKYHVTPNPEGIFVLNHGDFHMKNMMIRKNAKGALDDVMLFDYQMSFFGSPAIDVLYATTMLMNAEMRRHHRDELYYYYFSNFQATLRLIEYTGKIPTMTEFQMELLKHKPFELFLLAAFFMFNYVFANGDLAKVIEDEAYRGEVLNNPEMLQEFREMLPKFLYGGYFEN